MCKQICFPSFHLMELLRLYVCKALCVNLFVQESFYCQTFYTTFLFLCMIKFISKHIWSTRMVENFASSPMGHISHYKNTIQFIGQFYWSTSRNALNVLLRIKFALLGINVTLRNWLVGPWVLKTPYMY